MQPENAGSDSVVARMTSDADHESVLGDEHELELPQVEAFRRAVEEDVTQRLPDSAVDLRLRSLKRAADRRSALDADELNRTIRDQARYAYQVVACWYTIIFDPALPALAEKTPTYDDVDSLARNTVARAVVGFREELARIRPWLSEDNPKMKRLFLLECLHHLPDAYQKWLRKHQQLSWDDVEQIGAEGSVADPAQLLQRLSDQVRDNKEWVTDRLRSAGLPGAGEGDPGFTEWSLAEILDATDDTVKAAAEQWESDAGDGRDL